MITSVIIENDLKSKTYLLKLIKKHLPTISVIGQATSIKEGILSINTLKPQLLFLDIELDDGLAFEILKKVDTTQFEIIFITAHDTYYKQAIEHYAFSYILKPFDPQILKEVVDRLFTIKNRHLEQRKFQYLKEFLDDTNSKILLQVNENHISVELKNIFVFYSSGNYTKVHLTNNKIVLVSKRLKHFEELLSSKGFFKANRASLINTNQIDYIYKKETIVLKNNEKIHVSARNKSLLSQLINTLS